MDSIDSIFIIAIFVCAAIAAGIVIGYGIYSIFIGQRLIMRQKNCTNIIDVRAVITIVIGLIFGYQIGYDKGVKDYAAGKVVVVDLPNGDTMVCETKEKP